MKKNKLCSIIKLVNDNFKECVILLDDTLQRYTKKLSSNFSLQELHHVTRVAGDIWLERNKSNIEGLTIPRDIIRWDHWIFNSRYQLAREKINDLYLSSMSYQEAFSRTAYSFLNRYRKHHEYDQEAAFNLSLEYLKEECAVMCLIAEETNHQKYSFEVYPSKRNEALTATHEFFIKPGYPNLLNPVSIKFKSP